MQDFNSDMERNPGKRRIRKFNISSVSNQRTMLYHWVITTISLSLSVFATCNTATIVAAPAALAVPRLDTHHAGNDRLAVTLAAVLAVVTGMMPGTKEKITVVSPLLLLSILRSLLAFLFIVIGCIVGQVTFLLLYLYIFLCWL